MTVAEEQQSTFAPQSTYQTEQTYQQPVAQEPLYQQPQPVEQQPVVEPEPVVEETKPARPPLYYFEEVEEIYRNWALPTIWPFYCWP